MRTPACCLLLLSLSLLPACANGFLLLSMSAGGTRHQHLLRGQQQEQPVSRRQAIAASLGMGAAALGSQILPAFAVDVSPITKEEKLRENVAGAQEAIDAIKSFDLLIQEKNYYGLRSSLRSPPAGLIRAKCVNILTVMEEGPQKQKAQKAYSSLIANIEKMDLIAKQGVAGKLKNDDELYKLQGQAVELGKEFLSIIAE